MELLRFTTAGSINDGKSTLIGRLLYNTSSIKQDILESLSVPGDDNAMNLAFLTDGLRSEREQGITIDVAYKYFSTAHREYIISDAPGHFQYTGNLVSGASNVDLMIILIDARNGITDQTKRHGQVASFLKVPAVIIAVNKMDLVGYDEGLFTRLQDEYLSVSTKLKLPDIQFIPISALVGDNISAPSEKMPWYTGKTLLEYLETLVILNDDTTSLRLSIQCSIGLVYLGKLLAGKIMLGDTIMINPGGRLSTVEKITHNFKEVKEAQAGQNISLSLTNDMKARRGDIISHSHDSPVCNTNFTTELCWLDPTTPLETGKEYFLKMHSMEIKCRITAIEYKINNDTYEKDNFEGKVLVNDFASVNILVKRAMAYDLFTSRKTTGRGILIDEETNKTSGAFVITGTPGQYDYANLEMIGQKKQ